MSTITQGVQTVKAYIIAFLRWILVAGLTGIICGGVGYAFHWCVDWAGELRMANVWLIAFLPLAGLLIVWLYKRFDMLNHTGTNNIITSARDNEKVPFILAPLIFIATTITHLFGGSAGREGAALQLGGSIGYQLGKILRFGEEEKKLVVMCGMAGLFSALFGTPLTAVIFSMEVVSVGVFQYAGLFPCLVSAVVAYQLAGYFGAGAVRYILDFVPGISAGTAIQVLGVGVLCAVVSILFCVAMHKTAHLLHDKVKNDYIRIMVGGGAILVLTLLVGNTDYNGAGMEIVNRAVVEKDAVWFAFILKIIFTAITIGAGFRGGEIVPTFFVGATFGCIAGRLLGLDPGFSAALGFVAMFCGVTNCPLASLILALEVFGAQGILYFALVCSVSYILSGYYGLYSSQKIVYSKLRAEYIDRNAK